MELTIRLDQIVEAMVEAAEQSIIHPEMINEIKQLRHNGFNTRDLFGVRAHEFVNHNFESLPLEQRVNWFNSLA